MNWDNDRALVILLQSGLARCIYCAMILALITQESEMKISNSKRNLAQIIHENGGWREGMLFSWYGNKTKMGYFGAMQPRFDKASGSMFVYGVLGADVVSFECEKVSNWHQTILSRDEYFHLYPVAEAAPDADGWIEWDGGECPVEDDAIIDIRFRDGHEERGAGAGWDWEHSGGWDIIAYRLHKPEQECATNKLSSEAVSAAKIALMGNSIEELVRKPTIEQLAADYRNAKDYAERKRREADDAKADVGAKLKALELAGEALGLLVSPIAENMASQKPLSGVMTGDWRFIRRP